MKYIRDSCENLNAVVPILFFISLFSDFCFFYDIICTLDQASKKSKQTRKENGKRMRTKSRAVSVILSLFLVVVMLIGMTPVSAISIPNTSETTDVTSYKSEEFKVPDIIDEEEQAERAYTGRVKEDETDLYTFVFKNEDGSNTMRVFDHPVKYVNDKGETRDISLEISKDKDGSFKAADHMIKASFGNDISEGIGLEYCKNILLTTNVFTSRSHGGAIMTVTDELVATLIQLSDSSTGDYFISHSYSGMPSGSQCILNTDSFNNLKIVLFIGCKTGYGGDGAKNLPTAITNRGAGAAVGFCESIDCTQANEWTKDFYSYLIFGYTVQESVDYASGRRSVASGLRSAFVSGNGSLYLNDN